jgi:LysR family transcriptional regulator, transcriptional activator of the cysJI operon
MKFGARRFSTMNLEHLKVFHLAATKKNFSETAKVLHLSQPSVSMQIQQLESQLDIKLFERTTKHMELTESGKVLFKYAEEILRLVGKAKKDIAMLAGSIHGNLQVGASLTIGEYLLPYLLGNFSREFPHIKLLLRTDNSNHIIQQVLDGEIQIGFIEAPITHPKIQQHAFLEDELVVIASTKEPHPLIIDKDTITPGELFALPLILREPGSGTRQVMEESLKSSKLDPEQLNVVLELGNTESIKAVVESGLGISIISASCIQKELQLGTLRKIKIQGIKLWRQFYLVYDVNKVLSSASEAFIQYILNYFSGCASHGSS